MKSTSRVDVSSQNIVGHRNVFPEYSNKRSTVNENGINEGLMIKYNLLNETFLLINHVIKQCNSDPKVKKIINDFILNIQKTMNLAQFDRHSAIDFMDGYSKEFGSSNKDNRVTSKELETLVDNISMLAKHNTSSNTVINYFGMINTTDHIKLLLGNHNECQIYLDTNKHLRYDASCFIDKAIEELDKLKFERIGRNYFNHSHHVGLSSFSELYRYVCFFDLDYEKTNKAFCALATELLLNKDYKSIYSNDKKYLGFLRARCNNKSFDKNINQFEEMLDSNFKEFEEILDSSFKGSK